MVLIGGGWPDVMLIRGSAVLLAALGTVALVTGPVGAHGILESADPAPDSTAQRVPEVVSATLTEAPVPDGKFVVKDGCGRTVNDSFEVNEEEITAPVSDPQPGVWKVGFDFISKVDGHRYEQTYSFRVAGRKDCSAPEAEAGDGEDAAMEDDTHADESSSHSDDDEAAAAGDGGTPASDEGGFPIVPVALGSIVLVGAALLARRSVRG